MILRVELYAVLRDLARTDVLGISAPEGKTVQQILDEIAHDVPAMAPYLSSVAVAQGETYLSRSDRLMGSEPVCLFPPVSGGSIDFQYLTDAPIPVAALMTALGDPAAGAHSIFLGTVRQDGDPIPLAALYYEAHAEMVERECAKIIHEASSRWPVRQAIVLNRLGRVAVGEVSIFIGVSAGHRDEAYGASRFIIEAVKHRVPIWKKEIFADGSTAWAGACTSCV